MNTTRGLGGGTNGLSVRMSGSRQLMKGRSGERARDHGGTVTPGLLSPSTAVQFRSPPQRKISLTSGNRDVPSATTAAAVRKQSLSCQQQGPIRRS
jgi:hypothetical protein